MTNTQHQIVREVYQDEHDGMTEYLDYNKDQDCRQTRRELKKKTRIWKKEGREIPEGHQKKHSKRRS